MGERIPVNGTVNFREVTATTADGQQVHRGRLYRSDSLARLGRSGRRDLARLGVRRVIDLRTDFDRRFGGTPSLRGVGADRVSIPLHGGSPAEARAGLTLPGVYRTILGQPEQIGIAIRAIASAGGPVVIHCTAGKDRTGIVVALALRAIGVEVEQVIADYAVTERHLAGPWELRMSRRLRRFERLGLAITDDLREVAFRSPESAMRDTLAWLDDTHGSAAGYLVTAGIGEAEVVRLRSALLEPETLPGVPAPRAGNRPWWRRGRGA